MSACEKAERRRDRIEASRFGVLLGNALIDAADFARAEDLLGRTLQLAEEVRDPSCGPASTGSSRGCTPSRMTGSGAAEYARKDTCDRRAGRGSLVHRRAHQLRELDRDRPAEAVTVLERGRPLLDDATPVEEAQYCEARALAATRRTEEAVTVGP